MVESCLINTVPTVNEEKLQETSIENNGLSLSQTPPQIVSILKI